jgi:transcriptional regulator with XRE-family HTH domain
MLYISMSKLGDLIKKRRKEMKLTQEEVADRAKVSRSTIINIEQGLRGKSPGADTPVGI